MCIRDSPNPDLGYDINSCLNNYRPLRLKIFSGNLCKESSIKHLERGGQKYRDLAKSVLLNYPQVEVFDLADLLCDLDNCYGMKDGQILYRDAGHLSENGSNLIAPSLHELLRKML